MIRRLAIVSLAAVTTTCGSGAVSPATPDAPAPAAPDVVISVTATGFKPKDSIIAVGGHATFENIDDRLHSVASNPLTTHADCPPINAVGLLVPGQSKSTDPLTEAKACGYHDPSSEGLGQVLMGTITVR